MLDLAAGQSSTFFIARPPPTQAAKDEAASIAEATAEVPAAKKDDEAPASTETAPVVKPSYDISGFGFSFGGSSTSRPEASTPKAASPKADEGAARRKNAAEISRTTNSAWEELQRWPPLFEDEACKVCGSADADKGVMLECEKCEGAYHGACLSPPIEGVPDGEWFCPTCDVPHAGAVPADDEAEDEEEEEEEAEPVKPANKKRKAAGGGASHMFLRRMFRALTSETTGAARGKKRR